MSQITIRQLRAMAALTLVSLAWLGAHHDAQAAATHSGTFKVSQRSPVFRWAGRGWSGTMHHGETFRVQRLSGSYAYGMAYGHINRHVWIRASRLQPASADRASAVRDPFLGRISAGATLRYRLSRSGQQTVTIANRRATVTRVGSGSQRSFRAVVHRAGLKAGASYSVEVKINGRTVLKRRLYLHQSLNQSKS